MRISKTLLLFSVLALAAIPPNQSSAQADPVAGNSYGTATSTTLGQPGFPYVRPTQRTQVSNYVFDAFGPYPIVGAAIAAGVDQYTNSPPEWNQSVAGYGKRFGSDLGIESVGTTTRYGLAEALKEDTIYYRCECIGFFPRLRHAVVSSLTARRGEDGHAVFSIPALVAPYAGTMTAVYGWYPNRFGAKDAFRMGNYNMLVYLGGNISFEFLYSGPHSLFSRMHLNNPYGAAESGPNH
jgi:hypothetical protein